MENLITVLYVLLVWGLIVFLFHGGGILVAVLCMAVVSLMRTPNRGRRVLGAVACLAMLAQGWPWWMSYGETGREFWWEPYYPTVAVGWLMWCAVLEWRGTDKARRAKSAGQAPPLGPPEA